MTPSWYNDALSLVEQTLGPSLREQAGRAATSGGALQQAGGLLDSIEAIYRGRPGDVAELATDYAATAAGTALGGAIGGPLGAAVGGWLGDQVGDVVGALAGDAAEVVGEGVENVVEGIGRVASEAGEWISEFFGGPTRSERARARRRRRQRDRSEVLDELRENADQPVVELVVIGPASDRRTYNVRFVWLDATGDRKYVYSRLNPDDLLTFPAKAVPVSSIIGRTIAFPQPYRWSISQLFSRARLR